MKAAIYTEYGAPSVLRQAEIPRPSPKDNEILVKVSASTVSAGVIWVRQGRFPGSNIFTFFLRLMYGLNKPRKPVLGFEFSGVVEAVGGKVQRFRVGDEVFGTTTGLTQGAYAEYVCVPEQWKQGVVAKKPPEITLEEAAALPVGFMTALNLLNRATITPSSNVLIYGASGSVGTFAVQIAKYRGAKITAVCSGRNAALVQSLGAETVVDYTGEGFTTRDMARLAAQFDVAFDAVGKLSSQKLKGLVKQGGKALSVTSPTSEQQEYLGELARMIAEGSIRPVIDKTYSLENIVEAHEYVDLGHKRGNVVITVAKPHQS
ncbi:MAG: NAD(P)-dependent alcohol dehydrogenase [Candidatus Kapabacteria bacterium]|nr:NAD(P)-dependent alcohol dehydrogenase [Candidatus Kapabacteria bacterium]